MSVDLSTTYLGLHLKNPIVASASPLTGKLDSLVQLEEAGASAAVLPSLFQEQIQHEEQEIAKLYEYHAHSFAESLTHFPEMDDYNTGPGAYLDHLREAKQILKIPLIASLNGVSTGGWVHYAQLMEEAGADAIELNFYYVPTSPTQMAADVENQAIELVTAVRAKVSVPLAVKIGNQFTSLPHLGQRLVEAGADGIVLFNRWLEPDIDLDALQIEPKLVFSNRHELRLPLRWIAILRDQIDASLACTSGVHFSEDVIKALFVGSDVVMMASRLLQYGPTVITTILGELTHWLTTQEYASVEQLKGSMSYKNCPNPGELERGNYMRALMSYTSEAV